MVQFGIEMIWSFYGVEQETQVNYKLIINILKIIRIHKLINNLVKN
jgi:hypothetical protein